MRFALCRFDRLCFDHSYRRCPVSRGFIARNSSVRLGGARGVSLPDARIIIFAFLTFLDFMLHAFTVSVPFIGAIIDVITLAVWVRLGEGRASLVRG